MLKSFNPSTKPPCFSDCLPVHVQIACKRRRLRGWLVSACLALLASPTSEATGLRSSRVPLYTTVAPYSTVQDSEHVAFSGVGLGPSAGRIRRLTLLFFRTGCLVFACCSATLAISVPDLVCTSTAYLQYTWESMFVRPVPRNANGKPGQPMSSISLNNSDYSTRSNSTASMQVDRLVYFFILFFHVPLVWLPGIHSHLRFQVIPPTGQSARAKQTQLMTLFL
jgi:hypothetical protein